MMDMKIKEFKEKFKHVFGVVGSSFDELVMLNANEMLNSIISLDHIELDRGSFEVFRELDDGYFLRPFVLQKSEESLIDFKDYNLISALFYKCAMHLSTEGIVEYEKSYFKQINAYNAKIMSETASSIDEILAKAKYSIPYKYDERNTYEAYAWDEDFLKNLDYYLANEKANAGYKYRRFVWWFKAYQNGAKDARSDIIALDEKMSEILKGVLNGRG